MIKLGRTNRLRVSRPSEHGLYLRAGEDDEGGDEVLLPRRYRPAGAQPGDEIEVFVYRDSEDRPVATTERPLAAVGEFAYLRVVAVERVGAFLDWGLEKDLLLPFREQAKPVAAGDRVVAHVFLDPRSDRIVATTRLGRFLDRSPPRYSPGQTVECLVLGRSPLGFNVIAGNAHRGLVYHSGLAAPLEVGQRVQAHVREVRQDGKLDLALDPAGYARVAPLGEQILQALDAAGGRLDLDDRSPPEAIREAFGASKKAFKQALGALYKQRQIRFTRPGIERAGPGGLGARSD